MRDRESWQRFDHIGGVQSSVSQAESHAAPVREGEWVQKAMIGRCKLCGETKILLDSHYIPKGVYRRLRDATFENPNPWKVTKKTATQTSKQLTAYLLCQDCEQLLNKNGEKWVLANCLQENANFPLASILDARTADQGVYGDPTKIFFAANIPKINIQALAYFAVSIFWRGSIYGWNSDSSIPIKLGPFAEQFRRYLLGFEKFPQHCALWVIVREGQEFERVTYTPVNEINRKVHVCKFPMPGLAFMLLVSKNIPAQYRSMCLVNGEGNPIYYSSAIEHLIKEEMLKMFQHIPPERRRLIRIEPDAQRR